eukprot:12856042-Prorocentrum_lima.AAC.1
MGRTPPLTLCSGVDGARPWASSLGWRAGILQTRQGGLSPSWQGAAPPWGTWPEEQGRGRGPQPLL